MSRDHRMIDIDRSIADRVLRHDVRVTRGGRTALAWCASGVTCIAEPPHDRSSSSTGRPSTVGSGCRVSIPAVSGFTGEALDGALIGVAGGAESSVAGVVEFGEAAMEQPVVGPGEEQRMMQPGVGDPVAVRAGEPGDQVVHS